MKKYFIPQKKVIINMQYILMRYQYNLLSNLYKIEELTNSPDIVINEKISFYKIFKVSNMITGTFITKNTLEATFDYNEALITFPFKSKIEYRGASCSGKNFTFIIFNNSNSIRYLVPNGVTVSGVLCNFYFFI